MKNFLTPAEEIRLQALNQLHDPLQTLNTYIDFESFRPTLEHIFPRPAPTAPGRRAFDAVMMFKILILQRLYHLSDEQTEFQLNDRRTFLRFVGLRPQDKVPDYTTIWKFRETLAKTHSVEELFTQFVLQLRQRGVITQNGVIIDASVTEVPRQRNTHTENETIKQGEIPEAWQQQEHKLAQKDTDARWSRNCRNETFYGYKNHVAVDTGSKMILQYHVTDAAVHDNNVFEQLLVPLLPLPAGTPVHADTAYPRNERTDWLATHALGNKIQVKTPRGGSLTPGV